MTSCKDWKELMCFRFFSCWDIYSSRTPVDDIVQGLERIDVFPFFLLMGQFCLYVIVNFFCVCCEFVRGEESDGRPERIQQTSKFQSQFLGIHLSFTLTGYSGIPSARVCQKVPAPGVTRPINCGVRQGISRASKKFIKPIDFGML
ncbi:hypothetical protein TNCV_485471 [Trichonephila clavipes]|nr:hypothetical protein TNCV_485471 [Trichonephila clavipes]